MKWFKHLLTQSDLVDELEILYGAGGYYVFWKTLELMYKCIDYNNPTEKTVNKKVLFAKLGKTKRKTIIKVLEHCNLHYQKKGGVSGIKFKMEGDLIHLKCNKITALSDEYTTKLMAGTYGNTTDKLRSKSGQTFTREDKIREDKNTNTHTTFYGCSYFEITTQRAEDLTNAFGVSRDWLLAELRQIKMWLDDNPKKKYKDYQRFVKNWIKRSDKTGVPKAVNDELEKEML